jgi:ABC-type nitrate/sulfonate/bicarbonate transport system permease component
MVAGIGLGLLIGSVPALRAATASTIEFLRPIPRWP